MEDRDLVRARLHRSYRLSEEFRVLERDKTGRPILLEPKKGSANATMDRAAELAVASSASLQTASDYKRLGLDSTDYRTLISLRYAWRGDSEHVYSNDRLSAPRETATDESSLSELTPALAA